MFHFLADTGACFLRPTIHTIRFNMTGKMVLTFLTTIPLKFNIETWKAREKYPQNALLNFPAIPFQIRSFYEHEKILHFVCNNFAFADWIASGWIVDTNTRLL